MSQENVDLARGVVGDLQALFDLYDEDIVWDNTDFRGLPLDHTGITRGKRAAIRRAASWVSTWEDFRFEVEQFIDAGESVVLLVHETGRGKESGAPMDNRYCQVWTFSDGRIVSVVAFRTRDDALEAVGLPE